MPRNVEIKARVPDAAALRERIRAAGAVGPSRIDQEDVFFAVPAGRLKLRILRPDRGELIAYHRPDRTGPAGSLYHLVRTDRPDALLEVLSAVLSVSGRVRKHREVYLLDRTRIHLDRVEGLGTFVELEVVLADGERDADGAAHAEALSRRLGIRPSDRIALAYVDLLREEERP